MGKKRTNGDGSMRKRPDGRWECRVTIGILPDGKPKFKYLYGKTQKEVKEKLTEFQRDIDDGIIDLGVCFDEWAQAWYVGYKDSVAASTYEGYRYTLRILIEYFGSTKLKEIKALHVETFLKKMKAEGKSQSSITKFRGMLFQIMNKADAVLCKGVERESTKFTWRQFTCDREKGFLLKNIRCTSNNW